MPDEKRVVSSERVVSAPADVVFELIAEPTAQPLWDGNDNLAEAAEGQRVRAVGNSFLMTTTKGNVRENHVVEFEEGRLIAWRPAEVGKAPPGHLWRWELEALADGTTLVRHTYDWTALDDPDRLARARSTSGEWLMASINRLAAIAESSAGSSFSRQI